ncbi:peptide deformylase, mitochondrial-like [Leptidea sinapis]|uniref:Peptide deformylase n=1 Tax=Leptidea sinapis TaxID=189913 RepID=A0A5E4Q7P9_9NEOP|nr:peptide deformylase, mitochondrial-like [Leptidea sinapis]VVC93582.1 unnamed protein product [Leptidea sinapis]
MGIIRKALNLYARMSPTRGKIKPPYRHVTQIGDPRLRKICDEVPLNKIKTPEIQKVIDQLVLVLNRYGSVGMSAPQVGINERIFVMRHTAQQINREPVEVINNRGMYEVPLSIYVNPKLKIVDYQKVIHTESCESVRAFSGDVPRYKEVEITGYNKDGEPVSQIYRGWPARIAQHEMDHLDGKLYIDIMDRRTFQCVCWEEVNISNGKIAIPFTPE